MTIRQFAALAGAAATLTIAAGGQTPGKVKAPAACPSYTLADAEHNLQVQTQRHEEILKASKLLQKDPAGYQLFQTPKGNYWIPAGNEYVLPFNLAEQSREIYGTGDHGVQPGDIVLDCGANVGVWTRSALDHGAKLVVAFEPAPENIECYRRNYKNEIAAGRVILVPKGVWDKEDVLLLKRDARNSAADSFVMLKDESDGVKAPLTTIDRTLAELKIERVNYIKMDVEGAETRALAGARGVISKSHPRMSIAGEHSPTDSVTIPAMVKSIWPGYRMTCGPSVKTRDGDLRPDAMYFR